MNFRKLAARALVLCAANSAFSYSQVLISVSPETSYLAPGKTVKLSVSANNVTNLLGSHIVIAFDSSVVRADTVVRGSFLGDNAESAYFSNRFPPGRTTDAIAVDQATFSPAGVSGSGVLFSIVFHAVGRGVSPIAFQTVDLRDSSNHAILAEVVSGSVMVVEE